jgi:hypothetical protein
MTGNVRRDVFLWLVLVTVACWSLKRHQPLRFGTPFHVVERHQ